MTDALASPATPAPRLLGKRQERIDTDRQSAKQHCFERAYCDGQPQKTSNVVLMQRELGEGASTLPDNART
jgi:hypothetical protein